MKQLITLAIAIFMATSTLHAQVMPTIVGQGFMNGLIGVDVTTDGKIWVTEYGTGNDDGQVSIIAPDGTVTPFMTGLPSALNPLTGEIAGSFRTYQLPNSNKMLVVVGEGPHQNAEAILLVDKTNFMPGTPLTLANVERNMKLGDYVHSLGLLQSDPYNFAMLPNGDLLVADAGANLILKLESTTGAVSTVAALPGIPNPLPFGPPMSDAVPTDLVPKPDGSGYYVCQLTGFPFLEGASTIFNLDNSGNLTPWQTGFTCLTDLGYDPKDGELCAMQFGIFGQVDSMLNFIFGSSAVLKVHSDGSRDTIASGMIGLCPSFAFDALGHNLYVTDLFGFVYKYELVSGTKELRAWATNVTAYPNPTSEGVNIGFELETAAKVRLNVYDQQGRLVHAVAEQSMGAGKQSFTWEANAAQPGMYLYHLLVDGGVVTGLVSVMR